MQRYDPGYGPGGPGFDYHHAEGWVVLFHLFSLVLFLVLIGVIVWAVLRMTSHRMPAGSPAGPHQRDPALVELRIRYARGELGRDEFIQRASDLGNPPPPGWAPDGGPRPPSPEATPPDAG
jgi:putative membrane protein